MLLRLGYTIRNVGESQIAMFVMTGRFMSGLPEAVANLGYNTWQRAKTMGGEKAAAEYRKMIFGDLKYTLKAREETARIVDEQTKDLITVTLPPVSDLPSTAAEYYAQAAQRGQRVNAGVERVQQGITSPVKPLLGVRQQAGTRNCRPRTRRVNCPGTSWPSTSGCTPRLPGRSSTG